MSYSDAYITVLCDGRGGECSQELEVEAPFPYTHGTSMDRTDRDVEAKGWEVDGDQHFCEGCRGWKR